MIQNLLALTLVFSSQIAFARLATTADVGSVIETDRTTVEVKKDGTSVFIRDVLVRINNDQGRESQSLQTLSFNSRSQRFKVLAAETWNGDGEERRITKVPSSNIEIKDVGEFSQAFDSVKQAAISFPAVQVGSKIRFKFEIRNIEVPIRDFWSGGVSFVGDVVENFEMTVTSELPVYYRASGSVANLVKIEESKSGGKTVVSAKSISAIVSATTQEEMPFTRPDRVPALFFSSLPNWQNYGREMLSVHENLITETLPENLAKIRDGAKSEATSEARIQKVAATIAQEFRYFGDWRRRNGGYVPRTLEEIAVSRYGDCKDLSLISAAIYRSLGFEADMAWVYRGEIAPSKLSYEIPIDSTFNHAITRVVADGKTYWIDATNPVAFVQSTFPDIAGRPAYVLNPAKPRLEQIPPAAAEGAVYESKMTYDIKNDSNLRVSGEIEMKGRMSIGITARSFYTPVEQLNYELIRSLSSNGKVSDPVVGQFERGSRIVRDVRIPVQFNLFETGMRTSAGMGFPLYREDVVGKILTETRDRASDLYLEVPAKSKTVTELRGVRRVGRHNLNCDLKSPEIDLKRHIRDLSNGVEIVDEISVKRAFVTLEDLQAKDFEKFQQAVRRCFNRSAVILEKR